MNNADKPINPLKRANNAFYDEKDESFINRIKPLIGLTKREHFAVLAMQGYIANFSENRKTQNGFIPVGEYEIIAQHSVQIADELLKQLENK